MIRIDVHHAARPPLARNETIKLARGVLKNERQEDARISIIYIDDRSMIRMNRSYLKRRKTTDVLSFPLSDPPEETLEGEVYVNVERARQQARWYGATYRNEVARLVIHGVLHLLGYDDKTPELKEKMRFKENECLDIRNF